MEIIFEFITEFVMELIFAGSKYEKMPKLIRYLLILIVGLFFMGVIGVILYTGVLVVSANLFKKYSLVIGILLIILGIFMLVKGIIKFRFEYFKKANRGNV